MISLTSFNAIIDEIKNYNENNLNNNKNILNIFNNYFKVDYMRSIDGNIIQAYNYISENINNIENKNELINIFYEFINKNKMTYEVIYENYEEYCEYGKIQITYDEYIHKECINNFCNENVCEYITGYCGDNDDGRNYIYIAFYTICKIINLLQNS